MHLRNARQESEAKGPVHKKGDKTPLFMACLSNEGHDPTACDRQIPLDALANWLKKTAGAEHWKLGKSHFHL